MTGRREGQESRGRAVPGVGRKGIGGLGLMGVVAHRRKLLMRDGCRVSRRLGPVQ